MLPKSLSKMYILKCQLSPKFVVEEMPFKQGVKLERQFDEVFLKGFNCDCKGLTEYLVCSIPEPFQV